MEICETQNRITHIKPNALVLAPNGSGLVLEFDEANDPGHPWLCLSLGTGLGWLEFCRLTGSSTRYQAQRLRQEPYQCQGPQVSIPSVWWSRQAALSAWQ